MLRYRQALKSKARDLRGELTEAEQILWERLCRKQLLGVQFYRQKPIGNYIVDFYAAKPKVVVEVDGSGHLSSSGMKRDKKRDNYLQGLGMMVLRFHDSEVLRETEGVLEVIFRQLSKRLNPEIPPHPPFSKGGK
jgi:very-short-patch-repair endonuclease